MADLLRKYKSLYSSTTNSFGTGTGVTITPASVVGLPTDTEITLTLDRVNPSGVSTPSSMERIVGTISGGNFVVRTSPGSGRGFDSSTEQAHTSPVVEMVWNAKDWNDSIDAFLEEHTQAGAHSDITGTSVNVTSTVTDSVTAKTTNGYLDLNGNGTGGVDVNKLRVAGSGVVVDGVTDEDDMVSDSATKVPTQQSVKAYVDANTGSSDGWTEISDTLTYASATTFAIAGVDRTATYTKGTRIKLTQTSAKYFVVASSSFSTNTTVTLAASVEYSLANAAITSPYYSYQANPQGFPGWFTFTTTYGGFSANPTPTALRYSVIGGVCHVQLTATGNGTSNATTFTITVPINSGSSVKIHNAGRVVDNGTIKSEPGMVETTSGNNTHSIKLYNDGAFTGSGNKSANMHYAYEI